MFTSDELKFIASVLNDPKLAFPNTFARILVRVQDKLAAELEKLDSPAAPPANPVA